MSTGDYSVFQNKWNQINKNYHDYSDYLNKYKYIKSTTWTNTVIHDATSNDYAVALIVVNGDLKYPYSEGTAYDRCKVDEWIDPKITPGMISFVDFNLAERVAVLFGLDHFYVVQTSKSLGCKLTEKPLIEICEDHFGKRQFDHLIDGDHLIVDPHTLNPCSEIPLEGNHQDDWRKMITDNSSSPYISEIKSENDYGSYIKTIVTDRTGVSGNTPDPAISWGDEYHDWTVKTNYKTSFKTP